MSTTFLYVSGVIGSCRSIEQVIVARAWVERLDIDDLERSELALACSLKRNEIFFREMRVAEAV